uniref:ANK_REP_REGION domain-containing protein n=1 Tax=Macrostomum lignano TaxID=282301 RepID=A0A1I8GKF1_9PLAT
MDDEDFDLNEFGQYEFDFESIWSDADSQCRAWHRELLKACQNDEIEEQNRIAKTLKECIEDQNDIQAKALLFMTVVTSNTQLLKVLTERLPDLCLRVKSDKNNNILHFACCCKQTDSAVQSLQIIWDKCGQQLIKEPNAEMRTPLHISAQNSQNPDLLRWLASTVKDKQQFFIKDNDGKSAVHVAFEYQDLETLQTLATELSLKNCLSVKCQGRQILHITAMISEDPSVLLWLVAKVEDKQRFFDPDEDGKSAVYVAFNYQELDTLQALTTELGLQSCVSAKGPRRRTISHAAAENRSIPSVLLWLVSEVEDKQRFFDPDEDRESAIHVAFSCLNLDTLQTLAKELGLKKCISVKGPRNRTILHAAAENRIGNGAWLEKMPFRQGPMRRTILHAASENGSDPSVLLWLVSEVEGKQQFFDPDEDGESAVYVAFSCQNSDALQELAIELDLRNSEKILAVRVSDGPLKGATCLHFACESGHKENIEYLLQNGAKLQDETAAGQTCVDFAYNKGKLEVLIEVANDINKFPTEKSFSLRELLTLVDVAKKALKLPDKQSARNHLTKFNDSSLKASIQKDRTSTPKDAQEGRKKNDKKTEHDVERMSKTEESPEVQMLFRAFELDSTEMLRSLIGLGLVNDEIYDQFSKHILAQISKKQPNAKSPIMTTLLQYFSVQDGNSKALVLMEYAVLLEKPKLLTDLMLLPQFDIIPQTLRLLTYLKTKVDKSEILQRVQLQAYNTIINILDHLYANADEDTRELLFTYLTGSFRVSEDQRNAGPRFLAPHSSLLRRESSHADNDKPQQKRSNEARKLSSENDTASQKFKSVMDLVETLDCDDLFATECISNLVEQHWKRHPPLSWSRPQRCCTCNISAKVTIQQRFIIYSIFFLVFLLYFAWYVTDFSRTQQSPVPDIILLLYALSFTLQEVNDFINSISLKDLTILGRDMRIPRYFIDLFNYFDMAGLLLMWAGLVLKLLGHLSDPSLLRSCQVVLSVSFLFLGFRSVALLSYFKVTGPKINMLKSLLFSDLVPFMLVLLVLVYSFGIFFFNLLFPAFSDSRDAQALTKIFTVPVSLAFGMVESAQFESCSSSSLATGESCADEAGNKAYNGILVFVYLLLVNIVMWNLLIALFSRTVTELASRAEVLWRRNLFELLQEFAEVSPVPPPLSFPHYAWKLLQRCHACRCQPRSGEVSPADGAESSKPWWQHTEDFSGYPKDFKRFLIYQSEQLREHRPRLQWPVERNKGDIDVLKAHVENQVKDLLATQREDNEKMDERLDKLQQQMTNVMSILQQMQQQRQQ